MAENQEMDVVAVDLMVEQGLITNAQADRLKTLLKKGTSLGEAVIKTPLVDPIKIASIQSLAAQRQAAQTEEKLPAAGPEAIAETDDIDDLEIDLIDDSEPINMGKDKFQIKNLGPVGSKEAEEALSGKKPSARADLESLDMVELPEIEQKIFEPDKSKSSKQISSEKNKRLPSPESMAPTWPNQDIESDFDIEDDLEFLANDETHPPFGTAPPPPQEDKDKKLVLPSSRDQKEFGQQVGSIIDEAFKDTDLDIPSAPESQKEKKPAAPAGLSKLPPLENQHDYYNPAASQKTFDLSDDEGINLILEVNSILSKAIDASAAGIVIEADSGSENLKIYNAVRNLVQEDSIDPALLEKIVNRIKVMGRIETWRREQLQKGSFNLVHQGRRHRAYVHSENADGMPRLIVYFEHG